MRTLAPIPNNAFLLAVPYLHRLKSLTLSGSSDNPLQLTGYLGSSDPFSRNSRHQGFRRQLHRYRAHRFWRKPLVVTQVVHVQNHFPRSIDNLANISHITSIIQPQLRCGVPHAASRSKRRRLYIWFPPPYTPSTHIGFPNFPVLRSPKGWRSDITMAR